MKPHILSARQRLALLWLGAVSPLFQRLPGALTGAGAALWLSPVFALVPLGLTALLLHRFLRPLPGAGLGEGLCRCLGAGAGRTMALIYGLWAFALCAAALRAGAERFRWAVFPESDATPFLLVMTALGLLGALGTLRTLGRMAEVVLPFLLLGLGLVLLPALTDIEADSLLAMRAENILPAAQGGLTVTNTAGAALFAAFLPAEDAGERRYWLRIAGGWALLGLILCAAVLGRLGAELTEELPYPFFVMIRDLRLLRLLERAEALLCAQWVVTDFLLTAVLLCAGGRCLTLCFTGRNKATPAAVLPGAAAAVLTAWLAPEGLWAVLPTGNALLLFGGLTAALAIGRLRRRI